MVNNNYISNQASSGDILQNQSSTGFQWVSEPTQHAVKPTIVNGNQDSHLDELVAELRAMREAIQQIKQDVADLYDELDKWVNHE